MKILLISPAMPPHSAGEAEYAAQLSQQLRQRGHELIILSNPAHPQTSVGHASDQHIQWIQQHAGWGWAGLPSLMGVLRRTRPDAIVLIYTHWLFDSHPMITFLPSWLRLLGRSPSLLSIFQLEDGACPSSLSDRILNKLMGVLSQTQGIPTCYGYGGLLSRPAVAAALGPAIQQGLTRKSPDKAQQCLLIPPPPLLSSEHPISDAQRMQVRIRMGVPDGSMLLAYFGYVYPGKGVETLLSALSRLNKAGRSAHLCMIGGGRELKEGHPTHHPFEQEMIALSAQLGVADRVIWRAGYTSGDTEAATELASADMAVLPFDDGAELRRSSIAVVAAAGLPIITTQPRTAEMAAFEHEGNVLLCPPQDEAALATAIARVFDDAPLRKQLRQGALALSKNHFSWQQSIDLITQALAPAERTSEQTA